MSVELVSEVWSEIKRYIGTVDRDEAAETFVNVLINHDIDADDIRQALKGDSHVKRALSEYLDTNEVEEEDEDYEEDDYEEDDGY